MQKKTFSLILPLLILPLLSIPKTTTEEWTPICALKTQINGAGYIPNLDNMNTLKIDLWTSNADVDSDFAGGVSPYETIAYWVNGYVNIIDYGGLNIPSEEGDEDWEYLTDVNCDRFCNIVDQGKISDDWMLGSGMGEYSSDLSGITVSFDGGDPVSPDEDGYISIPEGATNFLAKKNGDTICVLVTFYEEELEAGDEIAPTYSNVGTNASHCREVCEFSCLWEDETELSGYILGWNGTGSFSNDSWTSLSGTSEWANKTKTLPNNDCIVSFQWWCNDTSHNWNTTGLQTLNVTDCYIFSRFTFSISNPEPNENIFFNGSYSVSSSAITSYEWTFGDGNTDSGATVTHSYSTENTFSITLNVTSSDGSDTFILNLTVAETQVTEEDQGSSGGLYSLLIHITWNQVPCFVNVTVQNNQGNDSITRQTDVLGNAKFNLPMGIYFVSTSYRNHMLEDTVHLNENSVVSFNFKVKGGPTWIALLAVIIVLAIGYVWIGKKKKTRKHKATLEPRSPKPTTKPRKHEDHLKPRKHKDNLKSRKHKR